jgi:hypothetical protein
VILAPLRLPIMLEENQQLKTAREGTISAHTMPELKWWSICLTTPEI